MAATPPIQTPGGLRAIFAYGGPMNQAWSVPHHIIKPKNKNKRSRGAKQPLAGLEKRLRDSGQMVPPGLCRVGYSPDTAWWSQYLASTHALLGETSDTDKLKAIRNSFYDNTDTRIQGICLRSFAIFVWHIGLSFEERKSCFDTFLCRVVESNEMYPIVTPETVFDDERLSMWKRWEALHDSTREPAERLALWHEWLVSTSQSPVLAEGGTPADETGTPPSAGAGTAGSGLAAAATEATKETNDAEASQQTSFLERLEEASPGLDEESVRVFEELSKSGELSEGTGFFAVVLKTCNAPDEEVGFPLLIVGDAPLVSVMGIAATKAIDGGYSGLGKTGPTSMHLVKKISAEFVRSWTAGGVEENCLQYPWTIQDLEANKLEDNSKIDLWTIDSTEALEVHERTRMSRMCSPWRGGIWDRNGGKGGDETKRVSVNKVDTWGGSEVTVWAMPTGSITKPHFDTQEVSGTWFFAPAAGTIRSVRRVNTGRVKRAIVVSAHDRLKVVEVFRLKLDEIPSHQYRATISLLDFAKRLEAQQIRFVVVDFPGNCSYILPPGCAHMFETYALAESSGWLPSLKVWGEHFERWKV